MLRGLVPEDVVRRREDEIYKVMGELAGIVEEEEGFSWPHSRRSCLTWARIHFASSALADEKLVPKLRKLEDS